jgi:hypothetical protein
MRSDVSDVIAEIRPYVLGLSDMANCAQRVTAQGVVAARPHHGKERGMIILDIFESRLILHRQPEDAIRGRHLFISIC